jgi:hypothetical protein
MAIVAGSVVALKVACAGLTFGNVNPQPPLFGVAEGTLPGSVIWYNGNVAASVASTAVDEILDPAAGTQALLGQAVTVSTFDSPSYAGEVIGVYSRSGVDTVQVKTFSNGAYYEALASVVVPVAGQ